MLIGMSALRPRADIAGFTFDVRFSPKSGHLGLR